MRMMARTGGPFVALALLSCSPPPVATPSPGGASPTPIVASAPATTRGAIPEGFVARGPELVETIVDGDTVVLRGGERIRVLGIDTPEMRGESAGERRLAAEAKAELKRLLASGRVVPVGRPGQRDKYDRTLAYLHVTSDEGSLGEDIGARLLSTGFARIYPSTHPRLAPYLQLQETARLRGAGVWTKAGMEALGLGFEVEINAVNAGDHVGERARVIGRIVSAHRSEGAVYLNLGPNWKRDFTAVIVKTQWELFPDDAERIWLQRRVALTGEIGERDGRPEIRLKSPGQIELLED